MSKKYIKEDISKTLSKSSKVAENIAKKSTKTTSNILKNTGKTAESLTKNTGKILSNTLTKSKSGLSSKQKPIVIDLKKIKLTIQISSIIQIILFGIFLSYVYKLENENCECSKGWEREYIKYYSIAIILFSVIRIISPIVYASMKIVHTLVGIGGIVFIFSVVKYIRDLKKEDCDCSEDWKRSAINIYAWLSIILLIITFFGTLLLLHKIKK
jgi:uncharacterized membrane protein